MIPSLLWGAKDPTKVSINLNKCENHSLHIALTIPRTSAIKQKFIFPSNVPGAISELKTGALVDNFEAKNSEGKLLKVTRVSVNEFEILSEGKLETIAYDIHDTWHFADKRFMLPQIGTSFLKGTQFLLNMHAVVGYIQGLEEYPYKLAIEKPDSLFGVSNLELNTFGSVDFVEVAGGYLQLIDHPILYSKHKVQTFLVGNTRFRMGFFSETDQLKPYDIVKIIKTVCESAYRYCKSFNTRQYTFLINYVLPESDPFKSEEAFGAIEHSTSSLYYFPLSDNVYKIERDIMFTTAHEMMHLYGPLQFQTDLTSRLNLRAMNPSANSWMYEGFTEYLSLQMLYQQELITESEFINEIRNKINLSNYADKVALETASKNFYLEGNEDMYRQFYNKGALTAMMLDLRLLKISKGSLTLKKLLSDLQDGTKENYVLKDEKVIDELAKYSYPEIKDFLKKHTEDTIAINYNLDLESIGWKYDELKNDTGKLFVNAVYRYSKGSKEVFISNISFDQVGFQEKDVLVAINNKKVTKENINELLEKYSDLNYNKNVTFKVKRGAETLKLSGPPLVINKNQKNLITIEKKVDYEQKSLRNIFRSGRPMGGQSYKILN